MQHQQYRTTNLRRPLGRLLSILLLVGAGPVLALVAGAVSTCGGSCSSPPSAAELDPELGVPVGAPLLAVITNEPPSMDGLIEMVWEHAPPLTTRLHHGLHGDEPAPAVRPTLELRSLYDEEHVYFLARWQTDSPGGEPDVWHNLFTMHWRLADSGQVTGESTGSEGLACAVACHTATADGSGRLIGIRSETIPPGLDDDLPAGGGWAAGAWILEWSRPRVSSSPYEQALTDHEHGYRFFVKLLQDLEGTADLVSDVHELRLE